MNDTEELQALVDAAGSGSTINLTPGRTYVVAPTSSAPQGVMIPMGKFNLRMYGPGSRIVQASGVPGSFSSIMVNGSGFRLEGVVLNGGTQTGNTGHRHGCFVAAPGFEAIGIMSDEHDGDGLYCYIGADRAALIDSSFNRNLRNGVTFGGKMNGPSMTGCEVEGNVAIQVDVEPNGNGPVDGLVISRCKLTAPDQLNDYVLTLGVGGHGGHVLYSELNGGVKISDATEVVIDRCTGTNHTDKASVTVWGRCNGVDILRSTLFADVAKQGIWVAGTAEDAMPARVRLEQVQMLTGADGALMLRVSATKSIAVVGGLYRGNGVPVAGRPGIAIRSLFPNAPIERVELRDARVESSGQLGLAISGDTVTEDDGTKADARINTVFMSGMSFGNSQGASSLTRVGVIAQVRSLVAGPPGVVDPGVSPLTEAAQFVSRWGT